MQVLGDRQPRVWFSASKGWGLSSSYPCTAKASSKDKKCQIQNLLFLFAILLLLFKILLMLIGLNVSSNMTVWCRSLQWICKLPLLLNYWCHLSDLQVMEGMMLAWFRRLTVVLELKERWDYLVFNKTSHGNSGASSQVTLKWILGNLCKNMRSFHKNNHQTHTLIVKNNSAAKETTAWQSSSLLFDSCPNSGSLPIIISFEALNHT